MYIYIYLHRILLLPLPQIATQPFRLSLSCRSKRLLSALSLLLTSNDEDVLINVRALLEETCLLCFQIVPVPWDVPRQTHVFCAKVCEALAMLPCPSCNSFRLRREVDKKIHSGFA